MSLSINAAASCQQVQIQNNNPAPVRERAWYEFESISEGFCVIGSVVQLVGGAAALCTGNPGPAIAMFVSSGLHLQGAENSRRVNRMLEIEASSIRLQGSVRTLQGTVHTLQNENANLAREVTRVTQVAAQLGEQNTQLAQNNTVLGQQNAQLAQNNTDLRNIIQNGDQTLRARYDEFYALRERMAATQARLEASLQRVESNEQQANAAQARLKESTQSLQNVNRQIVANTQRLSEVTRLLAEQTQRVAQSTQAAPAQLETAVAIEPLPRSNTPPIIELRI